MCSNASLHAKSLHFYTSTNLSLTLYPKSSSSPSSSLSLVMVQRKAPNILGHAPETKKSRHGRVTERQNGRRSDVLRQDGGDGDLNKKKTKMLRSIKAAGLEVAREADSKVRSIRRSPSTIDSHGRSRNDKGSKTPLDSSSPAPGSKPSRNPMANPKWRGSSLAPIPTSNQNDLGKSGLKRFEKPTKNPKTRHSSNPSMLSTPRTASSSSFSEPLKTLERPAGCSMRLVRLESMKRGVKGATCSSTQKEARFPVALDLSPLATEAEGTSATKVCPYNYCSLNGHRREPLLPPLKSFLAAKRRFAETRKRSLKEIPFSRGVGGLEEGEEEGVERVQAGEANEGSAIVVVLEGAGNGVFSHLEHEPCIDFEELGDYLDRKTEDFVEEMADGFEYIEGYDGIHVEAEMGSGSGLMQADEEMDLECFYSVGVWSDNGVDFGDCKVESSELGATDMDNVAVEVECLETLSVMPGNPIQLQLDLVSVSERAGSELEQNITSGSMANDPDQAEWSVEYAETDLSFEIKPGAVEDPPTELHLVDKSDQTNLRNIGQESSVDHGNVPECSAHLDHVLLHVPKEVESIKTPSVIPENQIQQHFETSEGEGWECETLEQAGLVANGSAEVFDNLQCYWEYTTKVDTNLGREPTERMIIVKRKRSVDDEEDITRAFNPRPPNFLPMEPDPERERVDLRHLMMEDKKSAVEWMVDNAIQRALTRLAPARRRSVGMLVQAFEAVLPRREMQKLQQNAKPGHGNHQRHIQQPCGLMLLIK